MVTDAEPAADEQKAPAAEDAEEGKTEYEPRRTRRTRGKPKNEKNYRE
jgi:hypothetical protein